MARKSRPREETTEPAAIGIRRFQLYDDLLKGNKALAYPMRFSPVTNQYDAVTTAVRRYIHDTRPQTGEMAANSGDEVEACYMPDAKRWELLADSTTSANELDVVQVHWSGVTEGDYVFPNASGVHEGQIRRVIGGTLTTLGTCWILLVDEYDQVLGNVPARQDDYYGPARKSGEYTVGADTRPLYVCRRGVERLFPFLNNSALMMPRHAIFDPVEQITLDRQYVLAEQVGYTFKDVWGVNAGGAVAPFGTGLGRWCFENPGPIALGGSGMDVGQMCGPMPGSWYMWSYRVGFRALSSAYTTGGVIVADFHQHVADVLLGKFYDDLRQGGAAALFEIMHRNDQHKLVVAGWEKISVEDGPLNKFDFVLRGTKAWVKRYTYHWELLSAYCEVSNTDDMQSSPGSSGFVAVPELAPADFVGHDFGGNTMQMNGISS